MRRRATSKKCAADAEKEIDMDEKEATLVENIEAILLPVEPNRPAQSESVNLQDIIRIMGEFNETLSKKKDDNNKEKKITIKI